MGNAVDPTGSIRTTVQPCELHKRHLPESHINHRHHIWSLGDGGPDIQDNIVVACPTGHYNIHSLLQEYKTHMGNVPYHILRQYSFDERKYAELGYRRLTRGEM